MAGVVIEDCGLDSDVACDLLIGSVGYESRSGYIPAKLAGSARSELALGYLDRQVLSTRENERAARGRNARTGACSLTEFMKAVEDALGELEPEARVVVDVSSMSRDRIGYTLLRASETLSGLDGTLEVLYAPGVFEPSPKARVAGGVAVESLFGYGGVNEGLYLSRAAIVGLGYDRFRAEASLEHLEINRAVLYIARGFDKRYEVRVRRSNESLISSSSSILREYSLERLAGLVASLQRDAESLSLAFDAAFLPLGPKIFAAACCVAAILSAGDHEVWRASGGEAESPAEVRASGKVVGFRVRRSALQAS